MKILDMIKFLGATNSTVGAGSTFTGDVVSSSDVRVAGELRGDVRSDGCVTIVAGGAVHGEITAPRVVIGGNVDGAVTAHEQLRVTATGQVTGDVRYGSLRVDDGGQLRGITTSVPPSVVQIEAPFIPAAPALPSGVEKPMHQSGFNAAASTQAPVPMEKATLPNDTPGVGAQASGPNDAAPHTQASPWGPSASTVPPGQAASTPLSYPPASPAALSQQPVFELPASPAAASSAPVSHIPSLAMPPATADEAQLSSSPRPPLATSVGMAPLASSPPSARAASSAPPPPRPRRNLPPPRSSAGAAMA